MADVLGRRLEDRPRLQLLQLFRDRRKLLGRRPRGLRRPLLGGLGFGLVAVEPGAEPPFAAVEVVAGLRRDAVGRSEIVRAAIAILTAIAAVVTDVLANGNLVIQGRQEVRTNREVRELTVAGIVRPEDISSANAINHTQIAEARISYGGRGDVSRVQAPPVGQALAERFSPF